MNPETAVTMHLWSISFYKQSHIRFLDFGFRSLINSRTAQGQIQGAWGAHAHFIAISNKYPWFTVGL